MPRAARITGTGAAFPARRVGNDELAARLAARGLETSDRWIRERTGIAERRYADLSDPAQHNSSLGLRAARRALQMAGRQPAEVDQIIYATCSPDTLLPATACRLQHKLEARRAWAMDINAACSGFVYGVVVADQFLQTGAARTVLVVGGEVLSPYLDWQDRTSCILFGDGAGAAVLESVAPGAPGRILASHLASDGRLGELFSIPAGGSTCMITPGNYALNRHTMKMKGREIFKAAVRTLVDMARHVLAARGMEPAQLDWFVPHQANRRIIEAVAERLGLPMAKVLVNLDRFGNTSAATIPSTLDEAVRDGRIRRGQTVLLNAFGAGLTYGAVLLRW